MKKFFYFGIVMSVLMLFACGKAKVEDVAKDHVKKQFSFDNAVKVDISKLKYTVTKKEGNAATVNVSGTINCDGQIFLVKEGGKWRISKKEALDVSPVAPKKIASHGEQKPESSHGEQEISHKQ